MIGNRRTVSRAKNKKGHRHTHKKAAAILCVPRTKGCHPKTKQRGIHRRVCMTGVCNYVRRSECVSPPPSYHLSAMLVGCVYVCGWVASSTKK